MAPGKDAFVKWKELLRCRFKVKNGKKVVLYGFGDMDYEERRRKEIQSF